MTGFALAFGANSQLAEFLDPIAAAGLLDVGLATTFRLHGEGHRARAAGWDTRAVYW
jgi:hypothetical protein